MALHKIFGILLGAEVKSDMGQSDLGLTPLDLASWVRPAGPDACIRMYLEIAFL